MGIGYLKKRDGSTIKIDDYRYKANGYFVEIKEADTHRTLSIPSSEVSTIVEEWFGTPSQDAIFNNGRRAELKK